jgi:hypothetical protein
MFPTNRGICFSLEANPSGWTKIIFLHSYRTGVLELAATPAGEAGDRRLRAFGKSTYVDIIVK